MSDVISNNNRSLYAIGVSSDERKAQYDKGVAIIDTVKAELDKGSKAAGGSFTEWAEVHVGNEENRLKHIELQIQLANTCFAAAGLRI